MTAAQKEAESHGTDDVAQFASELKMPRAVLLEQLGRRAWPKKEGDKLIRAGQDALLDYLRSQHGAAASPRRRSR